MIFYERQIFNQIVKLINELAGLMDGRNYQEQEFKKQFVLIIDKKVDISDKTINLDKEKKE